MGKIADIIFEIKFKCFDCGKQVINNRYKKIFNGISDDGICLSCLKKRLSKVK